MWSLHLSVVMGRNHAWREERLVALLASVSTSPLSFLAMLQSSATTAVLFNTRPEAATANEIISVSSGSLNVKKLIVLCKLTKSLYLFCV